MALRRAYLDHNASAPLLPEARAAMVAALDLCGNPSSVHREGRALRALVEGARRDVASLCGADAASVIFTSGATEAANHVLTPDFRMGRAALVIGRLYVSAIEHKAVAEGGRFAREAVQTLPVTEDGVVDLAALQAALAAHDAASGLPMVAVMLANNETGVIQPIAEIAAITKAAGGLLVVDAVQAAGRLPLAMAELGADFLILSSHKIGGPKGAGALVARGETLMPAALVRGGGQEKGHRSGTENVAAVAGFAAAARIAREGIAERAGKLAARRDALETAMTGIASDVRFFGRTVERLCNTAFFALPGLKAETGQIAFDIEGVALSAGSACSSGKVGESHVLKAMGADAAQGALRVSLGPDTDDDDIEQMLKAFRAIAGRRGSSRDAA